MAERQAYAEGMRRVSSCSEFMLRPGAGVWRSSRYASNLAAWQQVFPPDALKVLATEELEADPTAAIQGVLAFLGLNPASLPPSEHGRYCVTGKVGVLDEPEALRAWRASRLDSSSDEGGNGGRGIGKCAPVKDKVVGADGVSRYKLDRETETLLRDFFRPYNARLFKLLGRQLPWAR